MDIFVSQATADDIPQMVGLLHELFTQDKEFEPNAECQRRGLEMILSKPEAGAVLVLTVDGVVSGMVCLLYSISTVLGAKVAVVEDMIATQGHRRRGLGRLLVQSAIAFARSRGCMRLTLLTDNTNDSAKAFYRSLGFVDSPMVPMRLIL